MSGAPLSAHRLVAHRGWPARFPENTLLGIAAAIKRGARWVELDVQLTADGVPILFHDRSLRRSCRRETLVTQIAFDELPTGSASFADAFGDQFANLSIDRLEALGPLLAEHADVRVFVELKPESARHFGHEQFFAAVDRVLRGFARPAGVAAIISKDARLCDLAKAHGWPIGWVLPAWNLASQRRADELATEFLFCSVDCLPRSPQALWQGPWKWVAYTVNQAQEIATWLDLGMQLVETDDIGLLA
jgi:glycerophosphoryl diester phosphodiesterase